MMSQSLTARSRDSRHRRLQHRKEKAAATAIARKKPQPSPPGSPEPRSAFRQTISSPPASHNYRVDSFHRTSSSPGRPPIVSPTGGGFSGSHYLTASRSWEDEIQGPSYRLSPRYTSYTRSASERSVSSELGARSPTRAGAACDRSVMSDIYLTGQQHPHMRIDDGGADIVSLPNRSPRRPPPPRLPLDFTDDRSSSFDAAPQPLSPKHVQHPRHMQDDDVSSLGGVEENTAISRITNALIQGTVAHRPSRLSVDETALWEAIQRALRQAQDAVASSTMYVIPQDRSIAEETEADAGWEAMYKESQRESKMQAEDHDRTLRAIQRVLADVTSDRDALQQQLKRQPSAQAEKTANPSWEQERLTLQRELEAKAARISSLERELKVNKVKRNGGMSEVPRSNDQTNEDMLKKLDDLNEKVRLLEEEGQQKSNKVARLEKSLQDARSGRFGADEAMPPNDLESLQLQVTRLSEDKASLQKDIDSKDKYILKLKRHASGMVVGDGDGGSGTAHLQRELEEKTKALESAKMIIASLETASGSLAADMRTKVKSKDDELAKVKTELAEKQKMVDSLATELRDSPMRAAPSANTLDEEHSRRVALIQQVEQNVEDIRQAANVLNETKDWTVADRIAELVNESVMKLRASLEIDDSDDVAETSVVGYQPDSARQRRSADVLRLKQEIEEKTASLRRLEDDLRMQKAEVIHFRAEAETQQRRQEKEVLALYSEIDQLREHCKVNMDILTRKERELGVLRDSLRVEDDVGYISDDDSETDDAEADALVVQSSVGAGQYKPSQVEALAALLAHGSGAPETLSSAMPKGGEVGLEVIQARLERDRALKQLQTERQSLASAKMIISSLEKSNKSMMEDLRSRLHDSSNAIASLMQKSIGSEKMAAQLQAELEELRQEKEEERKNLLHQIQEVDGKPVSNRSTPPIGTKSRFTDEKKDDASTTSEAID